MAFDFLGTLSLEQLRDLRSFLGEQIDDIDEEINNLIVELNNFSKTRQELVTADSNFGGNVLDSIYETELSDLVKIPSQNDTNSAILVDKIKQPFIPHIKFKRERLEFKVKKITDYIEQVKESIDKKSFAKTQTLEMLNELEQLFNSKNSNHLFQTTKQMKDYQMGIV